MTKPYTINLNNTLDNQTTFLYKTLEKTVQRWTFEATAALLDNFEFIDWHIFRDTFNNTQDNHTNLKEYTLHVNDVVKSIGSFPSQKARMFVDVSHKKSCLSVRCQRSMQPTINSSSSLTSAICTVHLIAHFPSMAVKRTWCRA